MESKIIRGYFTKDLNWILKDKNYKERASAFLGAVKKIRKDIKTERSICTLQ